VSQKKGKFMATKSTRSTKTESSLETAWTGSGRALILSAPKWHEQAASLPKNGPLIRVHRCSSVVKTFWFPSFVSLRVHSWLLLLLAGSVAQAAEPREVVIDFETAEIGKPVPSWTERDVVFTLAGPLERSKATGRVMFFPYLPTERKGILNAMAHEQQVPLQARFPAPVSSVTLVLWGSTGCPAKLQAFNGDEKLVAEASVPAVPVRKDPSDPVPQFELTVRAAEIATIRLSGPRTGEFLAADEVRYLPAERKTE
jgi:hypothetical protein